MDRLCDEILQLIFAELDHPANLAETSKRLYAFSRDPYVRASYFLARHGCMQAIFWALGKGRLLKPEVIDIMLSCGAHLSRYLAQVAMHHYFRSQVPFVKGPWVRTVGFQDFTYFMRKAAEMYGNIPSGKGEDDGSVFNTFLKESRYSKDMREVQWEDIREILEKYKFIPFSPKDPLMAQFPLALSVEPRLLPYAVANGFSMNAKYRDFVFRKMFEKRSTGAETHAEEIIRNVRELCHLDSSMFVSRTVAAEVCMEAKTNEPAYDALKRLDKGGDLLFELSSVVEVLIKLFAKTRSVTAATTATVCRALYTDFPSDDPVIRLVLLLTIFHSDNLFSHAGPAERGVAAIKGKLAALKLEPLTHEDLVNVMSNPFVDCCERLLEYVVAELAMSKGQVERLVKDVAFRSLEEAPKGKTLQDLVKTYNWLKPKISEYVLTNHVLNVEDLPSAEDDEMVCQEFQTRLCREMSFPNSSPAKAPIHPPAPAENLAPQVAHGATGDAEGDGTNAMGAAGEHENADADVSMEARGQDDGRDGGPHDQDLGTVAQNTLTYMIRKDEMGVRSYRRNGYMHYQNTDSLDGKYAYPSGALEVGKWVCTAFGPRSAVTAVFLTHAIVNRNDSLLHYLLGNSHLNAGVTGQVPITLKHFKLLARLGRAPGWPMWGAIENGAEFYSSEEDYVLADDFKKEDPWDSPPGLLVDSPIGSGIKFAKEHRPAVDPSRRSKLSVTATAESGRLKRPRRSTANQPKSYAIPDSDDEEIADSDIEIDDIADIVKEAKKKGKGNETNLQLWIRHLIILQKDEQAKYKVKRKQVEKNAEDGGKPRVPKSEFFKSLNTQIRDLQLEECRRANSHNAGGPAENSSEGEDAEYRETPRSKRRRVA